jgi:hypothetical protein
MVTLRLLSRDFFFVTGVVLLVLGLGNFIAGRIKVDHYQQVMTEVAPHVGGVSSFLLSDVGSAVPSEAQERWEIARAKLDFYHVVLSGGQIMLGLGVVCVALALFGRRRRRWQASVLPS